MNVPLTPLDFLERARRLFGPLEAVVDGDRHFTYTELASRCHRLAHALRRLGVERGDRVAYLSGNSVELLEAYFGVVLAGAVLTPLNVRLSVPEMREILDDCQPRLLFVSHEHSVSASALSARQVAFGFEYDTLLEGAPDTLFDPGPVDENATCELFYSSGSTGRPKGAMLTHRSLATHALDSALTMGVGHHDVVLHTIPLFHVNGWGTPHWVTAVGARHVMLHRFDAGEVLQLIESENVTRLHLVPTMAAALLHHPHLARRDLSSLVQATVGGAPPGPTLIADLEAAFGCEVICGYGLTEAGPQLTKALNLRSHDGLPEDQRRRRRATTGLPNIGVDLQVLDDTDREVPWDGTAIGEICVRSNHVMTGYWNRPDETAEALRGGWLRTGDLATVDPEGYVQIVDRRKDIIVSGGENISSVQVEICLATHPSVLEVAVVGMADERWGEVPRAFVALKPESECTPEELIGWVQERLARFKAPRRVDILPELPKGGTGKIQKSVLRNMEL